MEDTPPDVEALRRRKEELLREIEEERAKKERVQTQCSELVQEIEQIEERHKTLKKEATFEAKKRVLHDEIGEIQGKLSEETSITKQLRDQLVELEEKERGYKQRLQVGGRKDEKKRG